MPIYGYECSCCGVKTEAFRNIERRDEAPICPLCVAPTMARIFGYGVQIVSMPWYEKDGIAATWPTGMSVRDKVDKQKQWERENDASWAGKEPAISKGWKPTEAHDIYRSLTPELVHKTLETMAADP